MFVYIIIRPSKMFVSFTHIHTAYLYIGRTQFVLS